MAVSYIWPPSLPQHVAATYGEDGGVNLLQTSMDAGPPKTRRRGNRPDVMTVGFYMTDVQVEAFEEFVKDTIRGAARFGFPHPRRGTQVEVKIVPESGSKLYTLSYLAPNRWMATMTLVVLP